MSEFAKRLPRLLGLINFEAAARCLSLTSSARELNVTQAAVSQQVRALENELGLKLFVRRNRGLELNDEGRLLYRAVATGFECIASTIDELRAVRKPTVSVGTTSALATFWLIPRLQDFRQRHPEVDVNIVSSDTGFSAASANIDVGIVFGRGPWTGFRATLLREGDVFPVCSPAYLRGRAPLKNVESLLNETLLMLDYDRTPVMNWPMFFASQGIRSAYHRRIKYNSPSLLLQATCQGQGIALGWSLLTDDLLARRVLMRPLPTVVHTEGSFYLIAVEKKLRPEVLSFQDWLLGQFKQHERRRHEARKPKRPRRNPAASATRRVA